MKKTIGFLVLLLAGILMSVGCVTDADTVSYNISQDAGMFKVNRRVIFYNGITDNYILTIEGRCQIDHGVVVAVTCKTGEDQFKKHYLRVSDNVTYFAEQLDGADVSKYHYKVIFKPQSIIPDVDIKVGQ